MPQDAFVLNIQRELCPRNALEKFQDFRETGLYSPRNDPQPWNDPQIDPEMIPIFLLVDPEMIPKDLGNGD